ncbi:hypothetical protein BH09BAC4_BH09BAC4_42360 [soil metagenome]
MSVAADVGDLKTTSGFYIGLDKEGQIRKRKRYDNT